MDEVNRSLDMFQYTYKGKTKIDLIIKAIKKELITLLGDLGIYVAICDDKGNIKYLDPEIESFYKYIQTYCKTSFEHMEIGSFAIPIKSLIFFRVSEKVMVVLSANISNANRLVTFVCKVDKYRAVLNHIIDNIREVKYRDTNAFTIDLFKSFKEQMYSNEIDDLFKKAEILLDKSEFDQALQILETIKKVAEKLEDSSLSIYLNQVIKKIESRLSIIK